MKKQPAPLPFSRCRLLFFEQLIDVEETMTEAEFSMWALRIFIPALVIFLGFIIYNLGKESKAGKFGMFILFLVLGLGIAGFLFKNLLVELLM